MQGFQKNEAIYTLTKLKNGEIQHLELILNVRLTFQDLKAFQSYEM